MDRENVRKIRQSGKENVTQKAQCPGAEKKSTNQACPENWVSEKSVVNCIKM